MAMMPKAFDVTTSAAFDAAMKAALSDEATLRWVHAGDLKVTGKQLTLRDLGYCSCKYMGEEGLCLDWPGRKASVFMLLIADGGEAIVAAMAVLKAGKKPSVDGDLEEIDYLSIDSASAVLADSKQLAAHWRDGGKYNESILGYTTSKKKDKDQIKADAKLVKSLGIELKQTTKGSQLTVRFKKPLTDKQIQKIDQALADSGSDQDVNVIVSHSQEQLHRPLLDGRAFTSLKKDGEPYVFAFGTGWGDGGYPVESISKAGVFKGYLCTFINLEDVENEEDNETEGVSPAIKQAEFEAPPVPNRVAVAVPGALQGALVADMQDDIAKGTEPYWLYLGDVAVSAGKLVLAELRSFVRADMRARSAVVDWPFAAASLYALAYDDRNHDTMTAAIAVLPSGGKPSLSGEIALAREIEDVSDPMMVGDWAQLQKHWRDGGELNTSILGRMTHDAKEKKQILAAADVVGKLGLATKQGKDGSHLKVSFKDALTDEQIDQADAALKKAGSPIRVRVINSHHQEVLDGPLMKGSLYASLGVNGRPYVYAHGLVDESCEGRHIVSSIKSKGKLKGYLCRFNQDDGDDGDDDDD